jgi:ribosomal protein S18 acetylase RimI-like enzyme
MPRSSVRVVRAPPGLVWRAFDADRAVGAARAFLRPDNRWFVVFDTCRADSYQPLLAAVAENVRGDLYTTARETDEQGLDRLARLGFAPNRRESTYLIPTDPAATGLDAVREPEDTIIISAADADEEQLRALDDALRQDVPGTAGWKWDPGDFREETFDSDQFDPAIYLVVVDTDSCDYVGLVRVWNGPGRPRLGLVGVSRPYRRRGLASALLARAFRVLHERGRDVVTAEADDANLAATSLLLRLGASRRAGFVEMVRREADAAGT